MWQILPQMRISIKRRPGTVWDAAEAWMIIWGVGFRGGKRIRELVSTAGLPKTFLSMAGVDVGGAMVGEDYLYSVYAPGADAGMRDDCKPI